MPASALLRAAAAVVEPGDEERSRDGQVWARLQALSDPRSPQGRIPLVAGTVAVALCGLTAVATVPARTRFPATATGRAARRDGFQVRAPFPCGLPPREVGRRRGSRGAGPFPQAPSPGSADNSGTRKRQR